INTDFVGRYYARWKEYPNFQAEGAYTGLHILKSAIEKANKLTGGWPDDEAIISQLEGLSYAGPRGYGYTRADNHRAHKHAMPCASKTPDPRSRAGAGRLITALATALAATLAAPAWGGHESPFYPSYYPQEIRLETVAPEAAGRLLVNASIHAYVGGDPFAG